MKKVIRFAPIVAASFILLTASSNAQTAAAPDPAAFQQFLQQFPQAQLPYVISDADLSAQLTQRAQGVQPAKTAFLAAEFYDFLPDLERSAATSRIPAHPQPVAAFRTGDHYAVLYNLSRSAAKQYKSLFVAVYDQDGRHLATTFVGGVNPNTIISAVIDENLQVKVQEFHVNWAKDLQASLLGNQLTGLTPLTVETLDLTFATPDSDWNNRHEPKSAAAAALAGNDSK